MEWTASYLRLPTTTMHLTGDKTNLRQLLTILWPLMQQVFPSVSTITEEQPMTPETEPSPMPDSAAPLEQVQDAGMGRIGALVVGETSSGLPKGSKSFKVRVIHDLGMTLLTILYQALNAEKSSVSRPAFFRFSSHSPPCIAHSLLKSPLVPRSLVLMPSN
ncbi:hypothetical protein BDZ97DRAFT_477570 [Flammula alnicola]|nr:hypothetical protein BDZ97DRAFT_477570 [Flammula alnicola]